MKKLLPIFFSCLSFSAFATHERAGEITYRCLAGQPGHGPYDYEITVTTYTKGSSYLADRCSLLVNFGDDTSHYVVCRSNYEAGDPVVDYWGATCKSNPDCSTYHMGEWTIGSPQFYTLNVKKNVYTINHTYPGPSTYTISMVDQNRNDNIINVGTGVPFAIQDTLVISPFIGKCDNSPILTNPPIDKACVGKLFIANPGAVDPDGDSLAYHLGTCFDDVGHPIAGYFIPANISLNPVTGDFIWKYPPPLVPNSTGCDEYNFAIDIEEWRKVGGQYILIGTVRRDMQVTVCNCANEPPVIANVNDTCVVANTALTFTVSAQDQGGNNLQSFTATGAPFNTTPSASFVLMHSLPNNSDTGIFSWKPSCMQVRKSSYSVSLKVVDDGQPDIPPVYLSDYKTFFITVIAPAPSNLTAVPQCTNMILHWDSAFCNNHTGNYLSKYEIYRKALPPNYKAACDTLKHGYCETGVPASWAYTLVGTVPYNIDSFIDNNAGNGLIHGVTYSYRVVALYYDGAESYCSDPVCNHLIRDVPIITNVDVVSTSAASGQINVKWVKPLVDAADFDTIAHPGPYKFELLRATGFTNPALPAIQTFTSTYFAALDTFYLDAPLNTQSNPYTYRIDFFYGNNTASCQTQNASSVFVSCNPGDRTMQLSWQATVPWTNYRYDVFRKNLVTSNWDSIGTTALQTFTDSFLTNGIQRCYKVRSIGAYSDTTLPAPLINWSEERCCTPVDLIPPCVNALVIDSSCELSQNLLKWTNPNSIFCKECPNCNDALYYIIYYSPVQGGEFSVLDTIHNINTTSFLSQNLKSIAGCYAVTSVDSVGNQSAYSNIVCVDNCPYYHLPNVFTPNGDGVNDWFTPIHPYRYVKDIDIKIYDRWGVLVFKTSDPEIMWNGKSVQTNMLCSEGVYYYVCIVNYIRLSGIVPFVLKGNVTILSHE